MLYPNSEVPADLVLLRIPVAVPVLIFNDLCSLCIVLSGRKWSLYGGNHHIRCLKGNGY